MKPWPEAGLWQGILAVVGGLLWASCFSREPWLVVTLVALVPLFLLLEEPRPRRRFLLGWLHGTVYWIAAIPWIAHTLSTYGQLPRLLSSVLLAMLALYLGLYHGLFLLIGGRLWRCPDGDGEGEGGKNGEAHRESLAAGLLTLAALPALWVVLELVRGWLFGGFPWNLPAYAWTDLPGALPTSAWIGAVGVSYLVLLVPTGLVLGLRSLPRPGAWRWAVVGLMVPAVVLAAGGRWAVPEAPASPTSSVRIIQPNIATSMTWDWEKIHQDYATIFSLSREACDTPGALLVWPESAAWPYSFSETDPLGPRLKEDLEGLLELGCPVLFNSIYREPEPLQEPGPPQEPDSLQDAASGVPSPVVRNAAFLLDTAGRAQRYDKRHLVPWGEYVPLKKVLPFVGKLARNAGDFQPADEIRLLQWGRETIGMGICYEMIFPSEVAASVRQGATVLATISNDAWYGVSTARAQHFRAARFRAAESRRPLLRAALNGISALVGADGRLVGELETDVAGVISGRIQGRSDLGPYSRWPWGVPWVCWLLTAFVIVRRWIGIGRRKEP